MGYQFKGAAILRPYWPDGCEHARESCVGTVLESSGPVDVYVWADKTDRWYQTCARFGARVHEYRSGPGRLPRVEHWRPADYLIAARQGELEGYPMIDTAQDCPPHADQCRDAFCRRREDFYLNRPRKGHK